MHPVLWKPSEDFKKQSHLSDYIGWLNREKQYDFTSYDELWEWSVSDISEFWLSIVEYFDVLFHKKASKVMSSEDMPGVQWFPGAELNFSEHIFRKYRANKTAIIFQNELVRKEISWKELLMNVKMVRNYLLSIGIQKGDRICGFLPNIPESIACFLAVNSLGAVWSCCSPDFGVETVLERFMQIEPKLFIACDGYQYAGKPYSKLEQIQEIKKELHSLESALLIPYLDDQVKINGFDNYSDLKIDAHTGGTIDFEPVEFNHPIWILYSSGTTGKPKAITHSHGGILLEHYKYLAFHNDVHEDEIFFWFSTTGWMMWNFMLSSLLMGAKVFIYDGSPAYPNIKTLWKIAEELPIHHFGTSAPFLIACMKKELKINEEFDMSKLKSIGSTGAPLPPETFQYIYDHISPKVWLCSMCGGTDVCTAFMGGNPFKPVKRGLIQSRALGCAMYAFSETGEKIEESLGEMIIEKPMPSMPVYFWNDPKGTRYHSSYFEQFPGKWRHGDWIKLFKDGSLIIQGRSDATLNRKGIRIGTAEIYGVLNKIEAIQDSLIINIELEGGGDIMPLFVVPAAGFTIDEELRNHIKLELKSKCSPRHVPDKIIEVPEIPYTLSGKKLEVPVKKIFLGMDPLESMNKDALRNPKAIDFFINLKKQGNVI